MTLLRQWELVGLGHLLLEVVFPALVLWLLTRCGTHARRLRPAVLLTTLATWSLGCVYRIHLELPICRLYAIEQGNTDYDGVGGNVAVLFGGWVVPLVVSLLVAWFVKARMRRRDRALPIS